MIDSDHRAPTTERTAQPSARCPGCSSATATRSHRRLRDEFTIANVMQIPNLVKIVVNMGVGEAARDSKLIEGAVRDLATITGQKPVVTRGPQIDRPVQAARRHADRGPRHLRGAPGCGSSPTGC